MWELFDDVVFATHSDMTLKMLSDPAPTPTPAEAAALGAVTYQPNEAILHSDAGLMPKSRKVWSSWSYVEGRDGPGDKIDLTYWMNSLQPIPRDDPLVLTLNRSRPIREELIHDVNTLHHPVYDLAAMAAQQTIHAMNRAQATWFCGAWMRNGFHEDGFASAVEVAEGRARQRAQRAA